MNKFYLTTAIPYVNAAPHIGFALELVQADTIARYHRDILKEDVFFSSGSDENSLKNVQAAETEGIPTRELVDKYAKKFEELKSVLNISYNVFNRTATEAHFKGAQKLWLACKKEDIYKQTYTGLYCVGCEEFYTEDELIDGHCPEHPNIIPEKVSEENYFFKLTNYQKDLEKLIEEDKIKIIPQTRKNEILSFIKHGLKDFSISRSVARAKDWGVPVPNDLSQIQYVWFDALVTYLTTLGYGTNEELFNKYWTEDSEKVHVIGKGIIRFHAVYWIAMLLSANLPLPNLEFVHGYITVNGQKISKSLGNTVDPFDLVQKYGTDPVRYYLLREIPAYGDGDFSEEKFKELYNADLANGLGNLVARIAKLCEKNNYIHKPGKLQRLKKPIVDNLDKFNFDKTLAYIWRSDIKWGIRWIDKDINETQPWQIQDKKLLNLKLHLYVENILDIAYNLKPFLPETAEKILKQFSGQIKSAPPLFPRLLSPSGEAIGGQARI